MYKALWNKTVIAESNDTIEIEGNQYFPPDSIKKEYFEKSSHTTYCGWKGHCSYYHINIDGQKNENAAWYYPDPFDAAMEIKNYVAFWNGVEIIKE